MISRLSLIFFLEGFVNDFYIHMCSSLYNYKRGYKEGLVGTGSEAE